jgi:hypothetical protein
MNITIKKPLFVCLFFGLTALCIWLPRHVTPPILQKNLHSDNAGEITVAQPAWGSQPLIVVFADTKKFPAQALSQQQA